MLTRSLRLKPKRNKRPSSHLILEWLTRGLEFGMLVFTLFWAVEANAQSTEKVSLSTLGLGLNLTYHPYSFALESDNVTWFRSFMANPQGYQIPETVVVGDTLSLSFKKSPDYTPGTAPILRF